MTSGAGWAERRGGPREDIHPGDVIWVAPGEKHRHGANSGTPLNHIAIPEHLEGMFVQWREKVTDEQCGAGDGSGAPVRRGS